MSATGARDALEAPDAGVLHLVVGASGSGKDTLMQAAARARPDIVVARRMITRAEDAGGEAHAELDWAAFERAEAAGRFALSWRAHGLAYGLPVEILADLAAGRHVLANGARRAVDAARLRFPKLRVLYVTAAPEVLAQRLAARGRESAAEIADRLRLAAEAAPEGADVATIANDGSVAEGAAAMLAALAPAVRRAADGATGA